MALDEKYFDSIQLDLVWKKYYSASKVDAVLNDIRRQVMALDEENEILRRKLNAQIRKTEQRQAESMRQQEYAVQQVQACYSRMRDQCIRSIEAINADWQNFLCGLLPEEAESLSPVPADMAEKVSAIASELLAIGSLDDK